jgi:Putative beta-lactamase-inhibitor-like, PepSY-like
MLLAFFTGTSLQAQVFNVPENAKKHFNENYKNATKVDWINNVANYDCKFKENGISCVAHYNVDGTFRFTEKKIDRSSVPAAATDTYNKSKYRDWKLKSVVYVENNENEKTYRFEAKKGIEVMYIFIDKDGKVIKENASL